MNAVLILSRVEKWEHLFLWTGISYFAGRYTHSRYNLRYQNTQGYPAPISFVGEHSTVKVRYFGYPVWRDIFPFFESGMRNLPIYGHIYLSWYLRILRENKISLWSIVGAIFGHKMGKYSRVSPERDPWIQGCYREIISVSEQEKSLVWYFINTNSKTIMWTCKQCVMLSIPTRAKLRGFLHPLSCPIHCHWSCYIVSLDIFPLKGWHECHVHTAGTMWKIIV